MTVAKLTPRSRSLQPYRITDTVLFMFELFMLHEFCWVDVSVFGTNVWRKALYNTKNIVSMVSDQRLTLQHQFSQLTVIMVSGTSGVIDCLYKYQTRILLVPSSGPTWTAGWLWTIFQHLCIVSIQRISRWNIFMTWLSHCDFLYRDIDNTEMLKNCPKSTRLTVTKISGTYPV